MWAAIAALSNSGCIISGALQFWAYASEDVAPDFLGREPGISAHAEEANCSLMVIYHLHSISVRVLKKLYLPVLEKLERTCFCTDNVNSIFAGQFTCKLPASGSEYMYDAMVAILLTRNSKSRCFTEAEA